MKSEVPAEMSELEELCLSQRLVCKRQWGPVKKQFGDVELEYADSRISVEIRKDRGIWTFGVADPIHKDDVWRDGALIQTLLFHRVDDEMSVADQVAFVKSHWAAIVDCFSPEKLEMTTRRLQELARERMQRLIPGVFSE
jgi:hypothetical protein